MNEDFEKWWISYICGDSFSISTKEATQAAWIACEKNLLIKHAAERLS